MGETNSINRNRVKEALTGFYKNLPRLDLRKAVEDVSTLETYLITRQKIQEIAKQHNIDFENLVETKVKKVINNRFVKKEIYEAEKKLTAKLGEWKTLHIKERLTQVEQAFENNQFDLRIYLELLTDPKIQEIKPDRIKALNKKIIIRYAETITAIFLENFLNIPRKELLSPGNYNKPTLEPYKAAFAENFNRLTYFAATLIVKTTKLEERILLFELLIWTADYLFRKLKNYAAAMALLFIMNEAAILRLKTTIDHLSPEAKKALNNMFKLIEDRSFPDNLNKQNLQDRDASIPYLGCITKPMEMLTQNALVKAVRDSDPELQQEVLAEHTSGGMKCITTFDVLQERARQQDFTFTKDAIFETQFKEFSMNADKEEVRDELWKISEGICKAEETISAVFSKNSFSPIKKLGNKITVLDLEDTSEKASSAKPTNYELVTDKLIEKAKKYIEVTSTALSPLLKLISEIHFPTQYSQIALTFAVLNNSRELLLKYRSGVDVYLDILNEYIKDDSVHASFYKTILFPQLKKWQAEIEKGLQEIEEKFNPKNITQLESWNKFLLETWQDRKQRYVKLTREERKIASIQQIILSSQKSYNNPVLTTKLTLLKKILEDNQENSLLNSDRKIIKETINLERDLAEELTKLQRSLKLLTEKATQLQQDFSEERLKTYEKEKSASARFVRQILPRLQKDIQDEISQLNAKMQQITDLSKELRASFNSPILSLIAKLTIELSELRSEVLATKKIIRFEKQSLNDHALAKADKKAISDEIKLVIHRKTQIEHHLEELHKLTNSTLVRQLERNGYLYRNALNDLNDVQKKLDKYLLSTQRQEKILNKMLVGRAELNKFGVFSNKTEVSSLEENMQTTFELGK